MEHVLRPTLNPVSTRRPLWLWVAFCLLPCVAVLPGLRAQQPYVASARPAAALTTPTVTANPRPAEGVPAEQPVVVASAEPTLLDRALDFIEPFEGRRHRVYRDSRGNRTIGVGFNLDRAGAADDLKRVLPGVGYRALRRGEVSLTDAQIDVLLRQDAQRAIDTARRQVRGFDNLPLGVQLIVVDMTFNTGSLHKWRQFKAALARQDYAAAADSMHRSLWRRQTGRRAEHLIQLMRKMPTG
jgi:GH24 family phage-related lysozyme (muramidase)